MTKGILCTIDFSDGSREAVKWALALAKELDCLLTILYTYRLNRTFNSDVVDYKKSIEKEAADKFRVLESELLAGSEVLYKFKIEIGFIVDRVEDHAKNNAVTFLVMDKKMTIDNRETFNELVEHVSVPLVIVP